LARGRGPGQGTLQATPPAARTLPGYMEKDVGGFIATKNLRERWDILPRHEREYGSSPTLGGWAPEPLAVPEPPCH